MSTAEPVSGSENLDCQVQRQGLSWPGGPVECGCKENHFEYSWEPRFSLSRPGVLTKSGGTFTQVSIRRDWLLSWGRPVVFFLLPFAQPVFFCSPPCWFQKESSTGQIFSSLSRGLHQMEVLEKHSGLEGPSRLDDGTRSHLAPDACWAAKMFHPRCEKANSEFS